MEYEGPAILVASVDEATDVGAYTYGGTCESRMSARSGMKEENDAWRGQRRAVRVKIGYGAPPVRGGVMRKVHGIRSISQRDHAGGGNELEGGW